MFKGSMVALVTPMLADGSLDKVALHELIEWHIASKTTALIIAGTTGECATLSPEEQFELVSQVVKQVAKRIPVIAGAGTNCTRKTIKLMEAAKRAGADACLLVTPYYNKPPQNGLYLHYKAAADAVDLPIILYNVPSRTACDLLPETVERLAKIKNVIAIKEATGNIERAREIIERCANDFAVYSGDDATALELILNGAKGVISVTANVAPEKMYALCEAALSGNTARANQLNNELSLLHKNLFLQANPIPTKWVLTQMRKIKPFIRLPLIELEENYHADVREAMQQANIQTMQPEMMKE